MRPNGFAPGGFHRFLFIVAHRTLRCHALNMPHATLVISGSEISACKWRMDFNEGTGFCADGAILQYAKSKNRFVWSIINERLTSKTGWRWSGMAWLKLHRMFPSRQSEQKNALARRFGNLL